MITYTFDSYEVGTWLCSKVGGSWNNSFSAIGLKVDGVLKVGVIYHSYTGENGSVTMGWRCDNPGNMTSRFLAMAYDYPFNQLNVKRINSLVKASNAPVLNATKKLGFTVDHIIKNHFANEDGVLFGLYRENCKYLGVIYASKIKRNS